MIKGIYILAILLFCNLSIYSQSILDFPANQVNKWGVGIENNFGGFITYKSKDNYFFVLKQSLYNSPLKFQLIEGEVGMKFFARDNFSATSKVAVLSNYEFKQNRGWGELDLQFKINLLEIVYQTNYLFFNTGSDQYNWYNNIGVLYQAWEKVGFLANWGHTPSFFFDEQAVNFSVVFRDQTLAVKPTLQIPTSGELKHSRILITFIYTNKSK